MLLRAGLQLFHFMDIGQQVGTHLFGQQASQLDCLIDHRAFLAQPVFLCAAPQPRKIEDGLAE